MRVTAPYGPAAPFDPEAADRLAHLTATLLRAANTSGA